MTANAAAAAKSHQSCPTLSNPMDCSPPGSSVHRIFQARVLEWGAIAFSVTANRRGKMETVADFIFLGSKITVDNDCSHKIKTLALGRKAMTTIDSILKRRDITLTTKVCIVTVMVFPVVVYRCEIWTMKKAECLRKDAFKLWCQRRLLIVPWTAKRSNQCILKEAKLEHSLEGWMLKLLYFGHLM